MRSSRKGSRRRGKSRGKQVAGVIAVISVVFIGYLLFSGDDDPATTAAAQDMGLDQVAKDPANVSITGPKANAESYGDVRAKLAAVSRSISGKQGPERQQALVKGYRELATLLEAPLPPAARRQVDLGYEAAVRDGKRGRG